MRHLARNLALVLLLAAAAQAQLFNPGGGGSGAFVNGPAGTGYQDVTEIAAPANPAAGVDRLYTDSTSHTLKCITSGGANCLLAGGTVTTSGTPATNQLACFSSSTAITGTATDTTTTHAMFATASGCPAFRAIVAGDIPTLNQSTTGSAAKWTTARSLGGNSVDGSVDVPFANKFLMQGTADAGLSNAQFMGALATGIVKNTTTTGVQSIASAIDIGLLYPGTGKCYLFKGTTPGTNDGCDTPGGSISGLTAGFLPKAASGTTIANSSCDDGVTTAGTVSCSEPIATPILQTTGTNGGADATEGTAAGLTAAAGHDLMWADSTAHRWKMNNNNGGAVTIMSLSDVLLSAQMPSFTGDVTNSGLAMTLGANFKRRAISFSIGDPGGSALTAGATTTAYVTVPFSCTISAWSLLVDAGTMTVKFWKVATGTAIPTSAASINTSGVAISTGTAIHSTTLTDFTTTAVSQNDIIAMNVSTTATAKFVNGTLECDQ